MNLIDVTLRESVYYGKGLSNEEGLLYLEELKKKVSNRWLQWVEIGYINNDTDEPLNYSADYISRATDICKGTFKTAAMMHIPRADIDKWDPNVISKLDLIRIVVGQNIPAELKKYVDYFHSLGVKVSANVTYAAGLSNEKILEEIEKGKAAGLDFFYCADSSGSFTTRSVARVCKLMLENCGDMTPGLHLHDHMQMALANAVCAQDCGLEMTDVSITGAGKGGGNLKMEQAILTLYGTEAVTLTTLCGLHDLVCFFSTMIDRDSTCYSQAMVDFLTGLFRLGLKATEKLEVESGMNAAKYFELTMKQYKPFVVE